MDAVAKLVNTSLLVHFLAQKHSHPFLDFSVPRRLTSMNCIYELYPPMTGV